MGGAILQLVTNGVQDMYLTGDPHITFFKIVYRRHTNFAIESKKQYFTSEPNFGQSVSFTLDNQGDLLSKMVLYVEIPSVPKIYDKNSLEENPNAKFAWVNNLGFALINEISIEINGYVIDKQYGEFMYIWSQLSDKKKDSLNKMIGNVSQMYNFSNGKDSYQLYIPINFWFCKNIGSALPLISIRSSEIKINVRFRQLEHCCRVGPTNSIEILENVSPINFGDYIYQKINGETIEGFVTNFDYVSKRLHYIKIVSPSAINKNFVSFNTDENEFTKLLNTSTKPINNVPYRIYNSITGQYVTPKPNSIEQTENINYGGIRFSECYFYLDIVYLSNEERAKFLGSIREYLIEQTQYNQESNIKNSGLKINLVLNHCCKSMYWIAQMDSLVGRKSINQLYNYTDSPVQILESNSVVKYYGSSLIRYSDLILNGKSRFKHGDYIFTNYLQPYQHHSTSPDIGINMYSFSLYPEDIQPSSTINMSKINQIVLKLSLSEKINNQNSAKVRIYTLSYNILRIFNNVVSLVFDTDYVTESNIKTNNHNEILL